MSVAVIFPKLKTQTRPDVKPSKFTILTAIKRIYNLWISLLESSRPNRRNLLDKNVLEAMRRMKNRKRLHRFDFRNRNNDWSDYFVGLRWNEMQRVIGRLIYREVMDIERI